MARVDFEDYELHEQIGAGTVGTIFRAKHKRTGDVVAIKLLSANVGKDKLVVARFAREMMILEKLAHPSILTYYGGGDHDGQLFFVMELVDGGTLKDLLSNTGNLSWDEAAESCRQVAGALQHAHNHGIIHRDLKPGNVFITKAGALKLGDFGIARDNHEQALTDIGLTVGTYSYMPPELVRGDNAITGQVDLYALGCVLFELMAGRPPFLGDNFVQIFDQHLKADPPSLAGLGVECPEKMEQLISMLLAKDPAERPFNARWVQGYLGEMLEESDAASAASKHDLAAADVSLARMKISKRVQGGQVVRGEVPWKVILLIGGVIAALIAILAMAGPPNG